MGRRIVDKRRRAIDDEIVSETRNEQRNIENQVIPSSKKIETIGQSSPRESRKRNIYLTPDSYYDRLIKYVPADVLGFWIAVSGLIKGSSVSISKTTLFWVMFIIGVVLTVLWTLKQTSEPGKPPAITQTIISTGSFIVVVFALGEPFQSLSFYSPLLGSLVLILYNLAVPLIVPPEG